MKKTQIRQGYTCLGVIITASLSSYSYAQNYAQPTNRPPTYAPTPSAYSVPVPVNQARSYAPTVPATTNYNTSNERYPSLSGGASAYRPSTTAATYQQPQQQAVYQQPQVAYQQQPVYQQQQAYQQPVYQQPIQQQQPVYQQPIQQQAMYQQQPMYQQQGYQQAAMYQQRPMYYAQGNTMQPNMMYGNSMYGMGLRNGGMYGSIGTNGLGIGLVYHLNNYSNVRAEFNGLAALGSLSETFYSRKIYNSIGGTYDKDLKLRDLSFLYDWYSVYRLGDMATRVTAGLVLNNGKYQISSSLGNASGNIKFSPVGLYLGLGLGHEMRSNALGYHADLGIMLGSAKGEMSSAGTLTTAQQTSFQSDLSKSAKLMRITPVLKFGVDYDFF